ncbi:imipenem/basic amino acid-specific outer membrane pore [Ectopseudomonas composti]|uniref:Imipenem/basic amino acid-specific outer membrane pore n=1 Tax=Ectopseudomonas composti TaxID=658457 RepID=A0A1I5NAN9_9GAMM|nr:MULTISPECIES: OprD family porin [Pseudomonas]QNH05480.1 OprD family porin [Pseudomonas sp. B11D7D]SFP18935.1 imipenem/basic amino acid-specific outer membrane pore [Pseudomonas composti]
MQVMKWSVIALAVAAGTSQMAVASSQSESNGFIEDSSFNIFNRALYMNRDFRNGPNSNSTSANPAGYREETGLGIRLLYESGFTQGTVGVGFDAHSLSSIKIDSGRGRVGNGLFSQTDDGRADDTQTEVGGAIKFRISDTVLKYGSQFVASPVFSTDDSRILPEVATGTYLVSNEIKGLELSAGRFTAMSSQTGTSRDDINGKGEAGLKYANIVGASYSFTDDLSAAFHASDVEDYWKKYYGNVNYNLALAEEQALNFDFNIYKTDYDKQYTNTASDEDNTIWSLAAAYSLGAHTFTLAHQRASGDRGYEYGVDGGGTIWLANSVQYSDFNQEDEKSWQARYDINMASYGVPGLSFMTRYIRGTAADSYTERELDIEAKYVIQEGAAKDLSFRVRNAFYRDNAQGDVNDLRLIVEYPLSVL